MKKAFDQTVRDLKRGVNKKVLKVPGIEQKILDATSNEPWGPHGSLLADIAHATRNSFEYQMVMTVIWKRINDTGKNWRHVYKGLTVLEYLVAHGTERVIDDIKEHAYQISTLSDFQYIDSKGRDQGNNVRKKSQSLVALVNDRERIAEVREKALTNRDKYRSTFAADGNYRSGGSYDDDRYEGRYGSRDDERYGHGRERDGGYGDDGRYGRYGDRHGRDSDDRYSYHDDDYKYESRSRSAGRSRDRPYDDDDRYSYRSSNGRSDTPSKDPGPLERKLSEPNIGGPPSHVETMKDTPADIPEARSDERPSDVPAPSSTQPLQVQPKVSSSETTSIATSAPSTGASVTTAVSTSASTSNESEIVDEFDPRGFMPAMPAPASGGVVDLFDSLLAEDPINSLALVPVSSGTTAAEYSAPVNSGFHSNFVPSSVSQPASNPFGDAPFMATQDDFAAQPQNNPPSFQPGFGSVTTSSQTMAVPKVENGSSFYGESLQAVSYTNTLDVQPAAVPAFPSATMEDTQPNNDILEGLLPAPGPATSFSAQSSLPRIQTAPSGFLNESTHLEPPYMQTLQPEFLGQSGMSAMPPLPSSAAHQAQQVVPTSYSMMPKAASLNNLVQAGLSSQAAPLSLRGTPVISQGSLPATLGVASQPKDKFETKSTVWADTINRGLVNLDISGPKANPMADIGVDFDSLNRKEKREREKSTPAPVSTVTMGKAMGSGSGIGRIGASGIAPPNPMIGSGMGMGMGMGGSMGMAMGAYGGGVNPPMGMGMGVGLGMGTNMGMGMTMRPNPGMPPPGMPGPAYNPAMASGGYGSQSYGGYSQVRKS